MVTWAGGRFRFDNSGSRAKVLRARASTGRARRIAILHREHRCAEDCVLTHLGFFGATVFGDRRHVLHASEARRRVDLQMLETELNT